MRSRWEAIHSGLLRSISGLDAARQFASWRARTWTLETFADPMSLVAHLSQPEGDLDEKDRLIWLLIHEARHGKAPGLAQSILFLGLWRALDAIFVRRSALFRHRGADLNTELVDSFVEQIGRLDPTRVRRVAATLVRNTERDVVVSRTRELTRAARSVVVTPDVASAPPIEPEVSPFDPHPDQTDEAAVAAIGRWLKRVTGPDAALVIDVVVHGRDRAEVASAVGISRAALNKRVERALARARRFLEVDSVSPERISLALVTA